MPRPGGWLALAAALGLVAAIAAGVAFTRRDGGTSSSGAGAATPAPSTPALSSPASSVVVSTTMTRPPPTTSSPTSSSTSTSAPTSTTTTVPSPQAEVAAVLAGMTLEQKVAQVFMVEVHGTSATVPAASARRANLGAFGVETASEVVASHGVGGVIYFGHNVEGPEQVAAMSAALQQAAAAGPGVGLLISTDQEGGRVNRIGQPATVFPSARVFGEIGDPALTERAARVSAIELRAMGVNQVLAPVADVAAFRAGVIGDRAYGSDPSLVAEQTAAAVQGYLAGGVAPTVKHFPGHGGTAADSHVTLPVLDADAATWAAIALPPFASAVEAGVPVVMVGHLALPAVDRSGLPATLSAPLVAEQLRSRLDFDGVVITDSLSMEGVRSAAGDGAVAVRALAAGADVLLMPFDFTAAYQAVLGEAQQDPALAARLDEAVTRVLLLKRGLGVLDPPPYDPAAVAENVGVPDHRAVLDEVLVVAAG